MAKDAYALFVIVKMLIYNPVFKKKLERENMISGIQKQVKSSNQLNCSSSTPQIHFKHDWLIKRGFNI